MKQLDLKGTQAILLDILEDIDRFCTDNGIRYSLAGGTLLGAVRHKGFIPWDDDADLCMPRPDYERFLATYGGDRYAIVPFKGVKPDGKQYNYISTHIKVHDMRTLSNEGTMEGRMKFGISVDIFPIEGLPDTPEERDAFLLEARHYKRRLGLCQKPLIGFTRHHHDPFIAKLEAKCRSLDYWYEKANSYGIRYPYESAEWAGATSGMYGKREAFRKEVFENYTRLPFEGKSFMCISAWDAYLSSLYGDYMTPPPARKQFAKHELKTYLLD